MLRRVGGALEPAVILIPEIRPDELLVRIHSTGVCHTDLAVMRGDLPVPLPIVLGHEGAGVIELVGSEVTGFGVGDHVALSFASCGECGPCRSGRPSACSRFVDLNFGGARADGTTTLQDAGRTPLHGSFFGQSSFATHAVVAARNAVIVPEDVPLHLIGPLGCGVQTGAGTVLHVLSVGAGGRLVVAGAGAVGLSAVMAAHAAGAGMIVAVDVVPARLELAMELGATHTVDARDGDLLSRLLAITGADGADAGIDTTAAPDVLAAVIGATRFGGDVASLGIPRPGSSLPIALLGGKRVIGVIEGGAIPRRTIPQLLELHRLGRFPFERLIRTYPFEALDQAIADTESGRTIKAVLVR